MPNGICALALTAAMQVGAPGPSETPNFPPLRNAYNQYGFEGQFEQRFPFDTQQNWVHGYFQEIPAYGGHAFFRPYNYKDILSQSQVSAGWGHSPVMPYSQQFWHKYHDQATMLKLSRGEGFVPPSPAPTNTVMFVPTSVPVSRPPETLTPSFFQPQEPFSPGAGGAQVIPTTTEEVGPSLRGPALQPPAQQINPTSYTPRR